MKKISHNFGDINLLSNLLVSYSVGRLYRLNPLYLGNPLRRTFANSEDSGEMQHIAAFYQGLHCLLNLERLQTKEYNIFENYNLTPLDLYNRLSQVYCIKPEEKNPLIYKGLEIMELNMSQCMRFPTMLYVGPAKPQISLRIRSV